MPGRPVVTIIGGGLAGVEAAWAAASRGAQVLLYEMRPAHMTGAHRTAHLAELVCSNSLKSGLLSNASGLLKEEMRRLGSLLVPIAEGCRVPAGEALAVDADVFAREVTATVDSHPDITVVREEAQTIPEQRPAVIATGPLTSPTLAQRIKELVGDTMLAFYDAVAPTVTLESLDPACMFRASRRGRSLDCEAVPVRQDGDYLNCPLTREEYEAFYTALIEAEQATPHLAEDARIPYFEGCLPIEELARRGPRTLLYGPMKPVGLTDPRTGRRPYAVVQLRQENRAGTLWGMVGFQTRLRWADQRRVFRMIPALRRAEFVRYGVMHRNTYLCSPAVLEPTTQLRGHEGLFVAGQLIGVEGYMESAAAGIVAGINASRVAAGHTLVVPPSETMIGALLRHVSEADPRHFAPMNANHGLLPPLDTRIRNRMERGTALAMRSLEALDAWMIREDVNS